MVMALPGILPSVGDPWGLVSSCGALSGMARRLRRRVPVGNATLSTDRSDQKRPNKSHEGPRSSPG